MKVLLGIAWYLPEALGGSEVYVRGLARHLTAMGLDVVIAAPARPGEPSRTYEVDGVSVHRFRGFDDDETRLDVRRPAPVEWDALLRAFRPDIVDLHSLTTEMGLSHLESARRSGARTLVTLHLPGLICARGTFMRFGTSPCDGDLERQPCTVCRLQEQGVPATVGRALSLIPDAIARHADRSGVPSAVRRPLLAGMAHEHRRELIRDLAATADRFIAVSRWQAEALVRNGVPAERVEICRQGVDRHPPDRRPIARADAATLKVGFLGRYHETKGLHVLVQAMRMLPAEAGIELHVWGVARTPDARDYRDRIERLSSGVPAVVLHDEARAEDIYPHIDVLCVPSVYFETGPLVVLEAHAWGVPVVGTNIGGIPERVEDGVTGRLVPPNDPGALATALLALRDPAALHALEPRHPVRTMEDAAAETRCTYDKLLAGTPAADALTSDGLAGLHGLTHQRAASLVAK